MVRCRRSARVEGLAVLQRLDWTEALTSDNAARRVGQRGGQLRARAGSTAPGSVHVQTKGSWRTKAALGSKGGIRRRMTNGMQ